MNTHIPRLLEAIDCPSCGTKHNHPFCPQCAIAHSAVEKDAGPGPVSSAPAARQIAELEGRIATLENLLRQQSTYLMEQALKGYDSRIQLVEQNCATRGELEKIDKGIENYVMPTVEDLMIRFNGLLNLLLEQGRVQEADLEKSCNDYVRSLHQRLKAKAPSSLGSQEGG